MSCWVVCSGRAYQQCEADDRPCGGMAQAERASAAHRWPWSGSHLPQTPNPYHPAQHQNVFVVPGFAKQADSCKLTVQAESAQLQELLQLINSPGLAHICPKYQSLPTCMTTEVVFVVQSSVQQAKSCKLTVQARRAQLQASAAHQQPWSGSQWPHTPACCHLAQQHPAQRPVMVHAFPSVADRPKHTMQCLVCL